MKHFTFKTSILFIVFLSTFALIVTGCGNGVGNGVGNGEPGVESGVGGGAFKGPIDGGTVTVYASDADGSKGAQLGATAMTRADGTYYPSIDIGTWTGPVLVEVTGGTYTDEATGARDRLNPGLRAVLSSVSGTVNVYVTPLTEIAHRLVVDTVLTIDQANSLVSAMVGVPIINTRPADVTDSDKSSKATAGQITYGLMLATISQVINDNVDFDSVNDAITDIKNDFSDGQLDTTGDALQTALTDFLANENNRSGVTTLGDTKLDDALKNTTDNPITPPEDVSDLNKAKAMVADLRNTVLSIYNYQGVGVPGVVETPFKNLADELKTKIEPELTATVERIGWIIESAGNVNPGTTGTFSKFPYELIITIYVDKTNASFRVVREGTATIIDSGTLTLTLNDLGMPISGTFNATMMTASGDLTANLKYSANVSGGLYTSMTFTGSMTAPGLSFDFSESGRGLHVELTTWPIDTPYAGSLFPSRIICSGRITTTTAQMDGSLDILVGINTEGNLPHCTASRGVPKSGTFEGSFEELKNGFPTGVKFTGKITGIWENALTYNYCLDESAANFPKWNASFDGKIEAPLRPTITAFLRVTRNEYQGGTLDVSYTRTNTDGTVVSLTGSGEYNDVTETLTATLSNQDGMRVYISFDDRKPEDEKFRGTITTSGGKLMANLRTTGGIPMVMYIDGHFESIF